MHDWFSLLPASGWERLAADAAWQSTLIAAAGLTCAWLARRRAALRAAILLSAAGLVLAVPLLSSAVRLGGGGILPRPFQPDELVIITGPKLWLPDESASSGETVLETAESITTLPIAAARAARPAPFRAWPWLAGGWALASAFLLLRLVGSAGAVRLGVKFATPCHDSSIEAALERAVRAIGVRRPELLWNPLFDSPALVVLGRPRLLLPAEMPAGVDWFAVCCHELAHLARRDHLGRLVVELAVIALPWQPLLWLVRRRFRAACEEACDDWAVAAGADPVEFAALLVELVPQRRSAFALGMAESQAATRHRILRLLAMQGSIHPRLGLLVGAAGWIVAIALAITVAMLQSGGPLLPLKNAERGAAQPPKDQAPAEGEGPSGVYYDYGSSTEDEPKPPSAKDDDTAGVFYNYGASTDGTPTRVAVAAPPTGGRQMKSVAQGPPWGDTPLADAIAKATAELPKSAGPPPSYVIEPPDVLLIDANKLVPKPPYHIEPLDVLHVEVANALVDQPINGQYTVDSLCRIDLGAAYGQFDLQHGTVDEARTLIRNKLRDTLREPQVSVTVAQASGLPPIQGEHLVGPDGTVNLGFYGTVYVRGLSVAQATDAVDTQLAKFLDKPRVSIDIFAYNSLFYYVVAEGVPRGGGMNIPIVRVPFTGSETVMDALAEHGQNTKPEEGWVWISRPARGKASTNVILPVDWDAVLSGDAKSNWPLQPGDRIFVRPKTKMVAQPPEPAAGGSTKRPSGAHDVSAPFESVVDEVMVQDGETVKQGQWLLKLHRGDLDADIRVRESNLAVAKEKERSLQTAISKPENGKELPRLEAELLDSRVLIDSYATQLGALKKKRQQLILTSPVDGQVHIGSANGPLLHRPVTHGQVLMIVVESSREESAAPQIADGHSLAEAEVRRGRELLVKGKIGEAVARFEAALALDPEFAEAHCDLGHTLAMSGDVDGALSHYQQALTIDPQLESALQAIEKLKR